MVRTHLIAATTHGRYLTSEPSSGVPTLAVVGFHGQAETAAIQLAHLERLRAGRPWLLASVQALNRYYTRRGDIVAAWMTREDRELAIADNVAYVQSVVARIVQGWPSVEGRMVFAGFSQGAAMAYRAAASAGPARGLVVLAGDVPPDVAPLAHTLPPVLIGRGTRETWYTMERAAADLACLRAAGVAVTEVVFEGGHERTPVFERQAGEFIAGLVSAC